MKVSKILLFFIFLINTLIMFSQESGGGEFIYNPENVPCLTDFQREIIIKDLNRSKVLLRDKGILLKGDKSKKNPLFIWPLKKADHIKYNEIWAISNYVDHNTSYPDKITDYKGGTRSYDTQNGYNHQGTDIFIWPYRWKMVDDNGLEVIAAAPGQIIYKHDNQFDRNCAFNNNRWNAIYIKHSDGSVAWYGHVKKGSLTSKEIGNFVAQGEYLGIVASSGNSTGPHLHFEVYEDDSYSKSKLIDPYSGPSNNWNNNSWWESQKPYKNPWINALTTNSAPPNFGNCPQTEITNEKNLFKLNQLVYFIVFLKDQLGESFNLKVFKPDNSLAYNWNRNLTKDYYASYWWFSKKLNIKGEWRIECTLSTGQTVNHSFIVGDISSTSNFDVDDISIYPNPIKNKLFIN